MSFDIGALREALAARASVARVVVAEALGSAPREAGAAMLVWPGGQSGTIGGGALEHEATLRARRLLRGGGGVEVVRLALGPAMGQCCGGAVTLVFEIWTPERLEEHLARDSDVIMRPVHRQPADPTDVPGALTARIASGQDTPFLLDGWFVERVSAPRRHLWIWGAGHVGSAVVGVIQPLPEWGITWVDTSLARFPLALPARVRRLAAANPADLVPHAPTEAHHLVMTYSHGLDLEICHRLLGHDFATAGLIGSETKWARFRTRLAQLGHAPERIGRIASPIGDKSLGKHPQAVAISAAAMLLGAVAQRQVEAPRRARAGR